MSEEIKKDAARLAAAIRAFRAEMNPVTEKELAEAFEEATLFMPVRQMDEERDGSNIKYVAIRSEDGQFFAPAFTSVEERQRWNDGPPDMTALPAAKLREMLPAMQNLSGVVVDFAGENPHVFSMGSLDRLAFVYSEGQKQHALQTGQGYRIRPVEFIPAGMSEVVSECAKKYDGVQAVYLLDVDFDCVAGKENPPRDMLLAVEATGEFPVKLPREMGEALRSIFSGGEVLHIGGANVLGTVREKIQPIYRRG